MTAIYGTLAVLTLVLAGCTSPKIVQTARAAVAASAATYGASLQAFTIYEGLPRCKVAPPPCSDAALALDMGQKLQIARVGVDRARDVVNMLPGQGEAVAVATLPTGHQALLNDAANAAKTAADAVKAATGAK